MSARSTIFSPLGTVDRPETISFQEHPAPAGTSVEGVAWSPVNNLLAVTCFETGPSGGIRGAGKVLIVDATTFERVAELRAAPPIYVHGAWWSPSGLLACIDRERVAIWDPRYRDSLVGELVDDAGGEPTSVAWVGDDLLAAAYLRPYGMTIQLWREVDGGWLSIASEATSTEAAYSSVISIGANRSGTHLAGIVSHAGANRLVLWELPTLKSVRTVELGDGLIEKANTALAWAPDDSEFVTAIEVLSMEEDEERGPTGASRLVVWDGESEPRTLAFDEGPMNLYAARWSPDGHWISCLTGEEILLLRARPLVVEASLPSFFSLVETEPWASYDDGTTRTFSRYGFTQCQAWSPPDEVGMSTRLAIGNVGGMRVYDLAALRYKV